MDVYFEYLVKRKNNSKIMLYKILIILALIIVSAYLVKIGFSVPVILLPILVLIGVCVYAVYYILGLFNVEYEYIITNDNMDVDKVVAKRKRKRLISVNLRNIEIMAPVSGAHEKDFGGNSFQGKIDAAVGINEKSTYFLICHSEKRGTVKLIFSPDERIIKAAKTFSPRKVFTD